MRRLAGLAAVAGCLVALAGQASAAGPPFPDPIDGQAVYDEAGVFSCGDDRQR